MISQLLSDLACTTKARKFFCFALWTSVLIVYLLYDCNGSVQGVSVAKFTLGAWLEGFVFLCSAGKYCSWQLSSNLNL